MSKKFSFNIDGDKRYNSSTGNEYIVRYKVEIEIDETIEVKIEKQHVTTNYENIEYDEWIDTNYYTLSKAAFSFLLEFLKIRKEG